MQDPDSADGILRQAFERIKNEHGITLEEVEFITYQTLSETNVEAINVSGSLNKRVTNNETSS